MTYLVLSDARAVIPDHSNGARHVNHLVTLRVREKGVQLDQGRRTTFALTVKVNDYILI